MNIKNQLYLMPLRSKVALWKALTFIDKFFYNEIGKKSIICRPIKTFNVNRISIKTGVCINPYSWLYCVSSTIENILTIGSGTQIGHRFHCVSLLGINIGENVLIADNVFVSDCSHGINPTLKEAYLKQDLIPLKRITIGSGSWIGENVSIIGSCVGKCCVIGANAVVKCDIPDYSIAVGNPAKVIKQYNFSSSKWERIND